MGRRRRSTQPHAIAMACHANGGMQRQGSRVKGSVRRWAAHPQPRCTRPARAQSCAPAHPWSSPAPCPARHSQRDWQPDRRCAPGATCAARQGTQRHHQFAATLGTW